MAHARAFVCAGSGEGNVAEAEALLEPYLHKYPKVRAPALPSPPLRAACSPRGFSRGRGCFQGAIIRFYSARLAALRGHFEEVLDSAPFAAFTDRL